MRAIVCRRYGGPDVLGLEEVERPIPSDDEVVIQVRATAVSPEDCAARKGRPFVARLSTGLRRPRKPIPGTEFAGQVEAVGHAVTRFRVGEHVFGTTGTRYGAHAEYVTMPETGLLVTMPGSLTHVEAARVCGQLAAWNFLVDKANVHRGQRVLINGASGSVGIAAIQLTKHFGGHVTGVCSTTNLEFVRSLGADEVIDYTREDFTRSGRTYDIIFDAVGKSSFTRCRASLTAGGVYLSTVPTAALVLQMLWTARVGTKRAIYSATGLRSVPERLAIVDKLIGLTEDGQLKSVTDRSYPLDQVAQAHAYVEQGHKAGNVVITP